MHPVPQRRIQAVLIDVGDRVDDVDAIFILGGGRRHCLSKKGDNVLIGMEMK